MCVGYHPAMPHVRCRIAPSPTGPLHIGTARTALYNFLFARRSGGTFILRLEDTDVARSTVEYERDILDGLHQLGLEWDEGPEVAGLPARGAFGPYRQMERLPLYQAAAERLLREDRAYPCYCTREELDADRAAQEAAKEPRYVGRCAHLTADQRRSHEAAGRRPVIRFRVGEGTVAFDDIVRGHVEIDTSVLGATSSSSARTPPRSTTSRSWWTTPMAITHVIRGEDHLSNTPKHILLFRALGADVPQFAHLPLILNPDRTKMSKRKSQTQYDDYFAEGFVREALVNHLALRGWASGTGGRWSPSSAGRAVRAGVRPRGWGDLRPGAARVAKRPMDPPAPRRRAAGPPCALPPGRPRCEAEIRGDCPRARGGRVAGPLLIVQGRLSPRRGGRGRGGLPLRRPDPRGSRAPGAARGGTTYRDRGAHRCPGGHRGAWRRHVRGRRAGAGVARPGRGTRWKAGDLFMAIRVAVTGKTAAPPLFDTMVALAASSTLERLAAAIEARGVA